MSSKISPRSTRPGSVRSSVRSGANSIGPHAREAGADIGIAWHGLHTLWSVALPIVIGCAVLSGLAVLVARKSSVELSHLLRDTVAVLDAPFYIGILSNLGILLWGATLTICLFAAWLARLQAVPGGGLRFFLAAAGLTAWLLADDALLLHEQVFPLYLGLPGRLSLLVAAIGTASFLWCFRRVIVRGEWPLLLLSLALFASSVVIDQLHDMHVLGAFGLHSGKLQLLLEDGLKLSGIALWLAYFARAARDQSMSAS